MARLAKWPPRRYKLPVYIQRIDARIEQAIKRVPYNRNAYDDPTVKRLMKHRDRLTKARFKDRRRAARRR